MTADDRTDADPAVADATADGGVGAAAEPEQRCWNCGSPLPEGAMFCGECGSAVGPRAARPAEPDPQSGDDAQEDDGPLEGDDRASGDAELLPSTGPDETGLPPHGDALIATAAAGSDAEVAEPDERPGPEPDGEAAQRSPDSNDAGAPPHGDALLESAMQPAEPEEVSTDQADVVAPDSAPTEVQPVLDDPERPHGDPLASGAGAPHDAAAEPTQGVFAVEAEDHGEEPDGDPLAPLTPEERFAAERLLDPDSPADKFVLQFSTGESATVYGSGLVGRNPVAEPGEYVDHLVVIRDPGRSVSKTHLEFGQDNGSFWVLDRFSGNGSALREPDAPPKRCEPGRRYFVPRGTRVEIGDQFFVVS